MCFFLYSDVKIKNKLLTTEKKNLFTLGKGKITHFYVSQGSSIYQITVLNFFSNLHVIFQGSYWKYLNSDL